MYYKFYGLYENPFALTPDPKYLFFSEGHTEALSSVVYGVKEQKGFILVLGEAGTGKTTLIRHILERLEPSVKSVFIFNSAVNFNELLQMILCDLELPYQGQNRVEMINTLNGYLLDEMKAGRYVFILIDEAQRLSTAVLEQLRMLSNLETAHSKLLQIALVGQPELGVKLSYKNLRQLRQRIGLVANLEPLNKNETSQYIEHRLEVAGYRGSENIFTPWAVRKIYRASGGIPRLINVICDTSLVLGYGAGAKRIGRGIVKAVVSNLSVFPQQEVSSTERFHLGLPSLTSGWFGKSLGWLAVGLFLFVTAFFFQTRWSESSFLQHISGMPMVLFPSGMEESTGQETQLPSNMQTSPSVARVVEGVSSLLQRTEEGGGTQISKISVETGALFPSPWRGETDEPLVPAWESLPASTLEVQVRPGDTLSALILRSYGRLDATLLDFVKMVNPEIRDINVIPKDLRLRFPPFHPPLRVYKRGESVYLSHLFTISSQVKSSQFETIQKTLVRAGYTVSVFHVHLGERETWFRILVGNFSNREQAEAFFQTFQIASDQSMILADLPGSS